MPSGNECSESTYDLSYRHNILFQLILGNIFYLALQQLFKYKVISFPHLKL